MAFIGNSNTTQGFTPAIDYFNGNGSTTAFTLSRPVASVAQVQVVIENVPQNPGSAYTVSGNTITFTSAPPSGTSNIYVYYTSPITQVIAPGQGTVNTTSLASSFVSPTATNLANGGAGQIPYQSASSTTAMLAAGTAGQLLQSNGAAAPSWITPSSGGVTSLNGQTGAITDTTLYAIGSYVTGRPQNSNSYSANDTLSGTSLYACTMGSYLWYCGGTPYWRTFGNNADTARTLVNTGTWRCMVPTNGGSSGAFISLWVRIS